MIKQGKLNLNKGVFRISKRGIDVDTAGMGDLLLDERVIYPQILSATYVLRPPSGAITIPIPDYGFIPRMYCYANYQAGDFDRCFPAGFFVQTGPQTPIYMNNFMWRISQTAMELGFTQYDLVKGVHIILMRP